MDKFVRDQLRALRLFDRGDNREEAKELTEKLIKKFAEHGIHEHRYKSLRLAELLQLIPDDDEAIQSVFLDIRSHSIKTPIRNQLDQLDLGVLKLEPIDSDNACSAPNGQEGDDDFEIIGEVIGNGAFNIKSEAPATPPPTPDDDSHEVSQSQDMHDNDHHDGTGTSGGHAAIAIDREMAPNAGQNTPSSAAEPEQPMDANPPNDAEIEIDTGETGDTNINRRLLRKRPGSGSSHRRQKRVALVSKSNQDSTDSRKSRRAFLRSKLSDSFLETELKYDRGNSMWKIYLQFSELVELDDFSQMLHSVPEDKFPPVHGLEMQLSDKKVVIQEAQLLELTSLPTTLLNNLAFITLNFAWDESINPDTFTAFLSACSTSLKHLKLEHGIYGVSQSSVSIEIPLLPNLKTLNWAGDYYVESIEYQCALPVVDVDESRSSPQTFVIDFGGNVYPRLKKLNLGLLVEMKFDTLSQFPKLGEFYVASSWNKFGFLRSTSDAMVSRQNHINDIDLPPGVAEPKSMCMPKMTNWFPNLTSLSLNLPTVAGVRSLVRHMADGKLKTLYMTVNFQFEAALTSAFLDIPFTTEITSEDDQSRLEDLKQYAHWESFVKYLKIDIPEEIDYENETESESVSGLTESRGIGSFKCLKYLTIHQLSKKVFLPLDDCHWSDPDVTLAEVRWSEPELPFPERVLLQELTKLKGKLKYVNLPQFQVSDGIRRKFKRAMGFALDFTAHEYAGNVDSFCENVARAIGTAIKPEK